MFDLPLVLRVKLPVVDRIHTQSNKFVNTGVGVRNKATGDSKHNDSPASLKHATCSDSRSHAIVANSSLCYCIPVCISLFH